MKYYGDYKNYSISIAKDEKLIAVLNLLASKNNIEVIIETGTYRGLGSTKMIAEAFLNDEKLKTFYTCEISYSFYKQAKQNLRKYNLVKCIWGCSVDLNKAIDFVIKDEVIKNHHLYKDVFIDDINDPTSFYLNELRGNLLNSQQGFFYLLFNFKKRKDKLLEVLINKHTHQEILFVLDSAGGVGYFEFLTVVELMANKHYYILLDDIHHLKHFRSKEYILNAKDFHVWSISEENGWLLAEHKP